MNRLLGLFVIAFALALGVVGCDGDSNNCDPGGDCSCSGGNDCYLACNGSGCRESCHHQVHCGGVCDDNCHFECHDMNDCTTSCGAFCDASCHNVVSCGAIVGPGSKYSCHDASRCGVTTTDETAEVAVIDCRNVTTCEVRCLGNCELHCENTSTCRVFCGEADDTARECADGDDNCGC